MENGCGKRFHQLLEKVGKTVEKTIMAGSVGGDNLNGWRCHLEKPQDAIIYRKQSVKSGFGKGKAMSTSDAEGAAGEGPAAAELKLALKAFKKRLKLTQLDSDSRLGVGPLSGGSSWSIAAIVPPNQYPQAVWDALVKQGKLKSAGHGMYSLVQP